VNKQKQTFVLVEGREFLMGSAKSELGHSPQDIQLRIQVGRTFAIAAHEVTKAQYHAFQQAVRAVDPASAAEFRDYVRTDDSAQIAVNWFEAARYCDWLSEREGIPRPQWCFDPKGGVYGPGMKAKDKFWELTGYRLPTQAEWEFACRAGTVTRRYYGTSDQLLPNYARFLANSQNHVAPVGTLEPNDFGLFDMLGNADELCFDPVIHGMQPDKVYEDKPTNGPIEADGFRVVRGGSFTHDKIELSSGRRFVLSPSAWSTHAGFRPARTYR
jgi:formylglycine-generating enzyme required for sulfatase activity